MSDKLSQKNSYPSSSNSKMVGTDGIRTIVGVIGNVISLFLFLSPVPTLFKICKSKSVQEFKPYPYVATVLNCAMWIFYGLPVVHPDSILVKKILIALLVEVIFMAIVVFITMTFLHTTKARSTLVGLLCIVFNIIMYTSPLTVMRSVIKTKSVKFMPFYLSLANFCNGLVWLIYALLKFDPYITIPNGLGALSGAIQLILYATYYKTTNWDDDGPLESSEVQLSNRNIP
ncbi:hypothetical protein TEA_009356 [Camellia sinensis var. sinensis]|uniref:Bidirectional sugar transporter SWEET n=1 Tax=Camellia sinensis var. sinensis TaxID=542762 RepID=A0A4S4ECS3_CAMSN|nr:hypothetical protein TEA_009356 [Camellia sinensis var. sinensis]